MSKANYYSSQRVSFLENPNQLDNEPFREILSENNDQDNRDSCPIGSKGERGSSQSFFKRFSPLKMIVNSPKGAAKASKGLNNKTEA